MLALEEGNTLEVHNDARRSSIMTDNMGRIAVTGGTGQFGRLVLERLVEHPAVESALSLDIMPLDWEHPRLEHVQADVRDPEVGRHFEGCQSVVHLAFSIHRFKPRELFDGINVVGSKNVFEGAAKAGVRQVVYASSAAAYGMVHSHPQPILEDTPRVYQPDFAYSRAKYEVEDFLDGFEVEHPDICVTRLRPVVMLGERMGSMMGRVLGKGFLPSTSGGPFPIVWDEDVADAVTLALEQRAPGAFNLSAREALPVGELAAAVQMRVLRFPRWLGALAARISSLVALTGFGAMVDPAWIRYSDVPMVLDSEKAREVLGWEPTCDTAVEVLERLKRSSA